MPFQAVPDTALVKFVYSMGGPPINNDFYVRMTSAPWTSGVLSALVDDFEAWWNSDVKPLQVATCSLDTIVAKDIGAQYGAKFEKTIGAVGTRAGTPLPSTQAAGVRFIGDPGNPPREGKIFLPGAAEADADANLFTQGYVDDVQAAFEVLRGGPGFTISQALVIVSRYSGTHLTPVDAKGRIKRVPTAREEAVTNTLSNVTVSRRIWIQKNRRPDPL